MRLALAIVLCCATTARADLGVSLFGTSARYGDEAQRSGGLAVELSLDYTRWQYFAEVAFGSILLGDEDLMYNSDGVMLRGALGVRYLARRFEIENILAFELGFEALAGMQDLEWRSDRMSEREVRPEIAAGFNWNFEFTKWKFASRWSVRAFVTPAPTPSGDVCFGKCATNQHLVSGYMVLMGVTW